MGTLADSLFTVLMSWVRALVSGIWALFSSEDTTVLGFLGKNWMIIAGVMIVAGLVIDWLIWLVRWQPYHIWAQRVRRLLGEEPEEEQKPAPKARAAVARGRTMPKPPAEPVYEEPAHEQEDFAELDVEDEQLAMERANDVPDETLGAYPGMRYGAQTAAMSGTQRYSVINAEGPGAAEVERRRAEIDAWQQQMQDEARARARAEREAREQEEAQRRQEAEARMREEEERRQQALRDAEAARIAAQEAEAARQAQLEYERQMAEYERQKAQYERDLAEYERQKAEYDNQMARQAEETASVSVEAAQEYGAAPRRRRATGQTMRMSAIEEPAYSDYLDGETVEELPAPPAWPDAKKTAKAVTKKKKAVPKPKEHKLLSRMAQMIEAEDEELASIGALPPRVDMHDAYKPAKTPRSGSQQ